MFAFSEKTWLKILGSKWLTIFVVAEIIYCLSITAFYFYLCNTSLLGIIKAVFCNWLAISITLCLGPISFGLTLDQPALKKIFLRSIYQERIKLAFRRSLPKMAEKMAKALQKESDAIATFNEWKKRQIMTPLAHHYYQTVIHPLLHAHRKSGTAFSAKILTAKKAA